MLRFRDITPRGFYARSLLIVLLPLVVLLITMTWFFFDTHIAQVSRKLSQSVSGEVAEVTRRFVVADPQGGLSEEQISAMSETLRLSVSVLQETSLPETQSTSYFFPSMSFIDVFTEVFPPPCKTNSLFLPNSLVV